SVALDRAGITVFSRHHVLAGGPASERRRSAREEIHARPNRGWADGLGVRLFGARSPRQLNGRSRRLLTKLVRLLRRRQRHPVFGRTGRGARLAWRESRLNHSFLPRTLAIVPVPHRKRGRRKSSGSRYWGNSIACSAMHHQSPCPRFGRQGV